MRFELDRCLPSRAFVEVAVATEDERAAVGVALPEEQGGFSVSVPALPGCVSQGETREEALAMIREAIEGYLESLEAHGDPPPLYEEALLEQGFLVAGGPRASTSAILNRMVQYPSSVDHAFGALADPTRRAVLERLVAGSATVGELAEPFGMSLTGMRKHIRLLEEAELVTTEKVGRVRRCMLAPYAFEGISSWLQRLDRFAQVVERTKGAR